MDAVERLLSNCEAPSLHSLIKDLQTKQALAKLHSTADAEKNRCVWDAMGSDSRFVRMENFPANRQQAFDALDPWLKSELNAIQKSKPLDVLCLAAGGGTHGPLLALAGASVTVVDFSAKQIEIDQKVAVQLGLELKTFQASMDDLSVLASQSFDIVVQPVSTCYLHDVARIYQEVARVTRPHGLYIAQHKQPAALQAGLRWEEGFGYVIGTPAEDGQVAPKVSDRTVFRENETTEYIHSFNSLLGGLCQSGFVIEDFMEPPRGDAWAVKNTPGHRSRFLPPYMKVKARRR
jgi:SAM-dependent methyltransferase